jgi:endonuclease-3
VAEAIRPGGLAAQKAPRIQHVLRNVYERFGAYDLSVLHEMSRDEARALLMSLGSGIGHKTASCVLLFDVGLPAFCVDTHIQRVCARLGLIGPRDSAEKAQYLLEATVPPEDTYAMHVDMIRHGRQICRAQRPRCMPCPLRDVCLYGSTVA